MSILRKGHNQITWKGIDNQADYGYGLRYENTHGAVHKTSPSVSGWRPPTPWSRHILRKTGPSVSVSGWFAVSNMTGFMSGSFAYDRITQVSIPSWVTDTVLNRAIMKLLGNDVEIGEDIGQAQQTADMVGDRAKQIGRSITRYKDSRPRDWLKVKRLTSFGRKKLGAIPNSWLELQYGWIPLLTDAFGACQALESSLSDDTNRRITVRAGHSERNLSRSWKGAYVSFGSGVYPIVEMDLYALSSYGAYCRLDYHIDNPVVHTLAELGLINPVAIAWNLVPYTFVSDWFIPIGSYLQAWTADAGLTFLGGSMSTYRKTVLDTVVSKGAPYGPYLSVPIYDQGECFMLDVNRQVFDSSPAPRLPHFKNPLSLSHMANGLSLLATNLR